MVSTAVKLSETRVNVSKRKKTSPSKPNDEKDDIIASCWVQWVEFCNDKGDGLL